MEKYEVLGQVGEGSFGQVYKAKKLCNGEIVAFKIITKRARTFNELKSLRQECEIQRHLHHPNIVQMIDSFETENQIVVVTEYADRELYEILDKEGRFSEEKAQMIVCDLVSALYYLHSNRVLHRDLKPQNVLIEANGIAKLCDFGFARSMSTGTHVLTSIKGTPLYMAPELIEECPYDHNADLWSLGCIAYEMIVGKPPFQTTSILHLVRLIRFESIKWPDFISSNCKTFLQGLLQKDPSKRLSWPQLLDHPFVKNGILLVNGGGLTSFTSPLSASQALAKKQQLENLSLKSMNQSRILEKTIKNLQEQKHYGTCISQPKYQMVHDDGDGGIICQRAQTYRHQLIESEPSGTNSSASVDVLLDNLSLRASLHSDLITVNETSPINCLNSACIISTINMPNYLCKYPQDTGENSSLNIIGDINVNENIVNCSNQQSHLSHDYEQEFINIEDVEKQCRRLPNWEARIIDQHIENEEWIAFLQRSMEEIIEGEIASLIEETCLSIFVSPLRNSAASCQVIEYVACLLSLPFVVSICHEDLNKIQQVYLDVRVVPNLVCAMRLLMTVCSNSTEKIIVNDKKNTTRLASTLSADELQALECSMLILCRLVYANEQFLTQFCDAIYIVNGIPLLQQLFTLEKRKSRVVADLLAILNNILRTQPENAEIVEEIVFGVKNSCESIEQLTKLLTHRQQILKTRVCTLIRLLARFCSTALQRIWGKQLRNLVEQLTNDDDNTVKNTAKNTVNELEQLMYYNQQCPMD
ncbi:hypothetical protein PV327_008034 [Microctonus hyperodae]|uniref:non-specific serine/threonine protein kinase n=1 Tax=Microctonus hyperodae TaxID=165561 RepID=A0AA39G155_MICHY|nr:hypothetical protein PV327_008034 [Microctonus hyperodae]